MTRREWFLVGGAIVATFILYNWGLAAPMIAAGWVANVFERGKRLSKSTLVDGVVQELPPELQDQASSTLGFTADLDVYSLARMGRSEGVDGMEFRMHVTLNDLEDLQRRYGTNIYSSVTALLTHSKITRANDHYSQQSLGKRQSTAHDPYEGDYALAQKVIADRARGIDPTGGATKFVDKSGPFEIDGEAATYADIVDEWGKAGYRPVEGLPGASDNFVVFVRG